MAMAIEGTQGSQQQQQWQSCGMHMYRQNPIHMLREEVFGDGQEQRTFVFSYGCPDLLRQAKLESMQARINQRMAEARRARGEDPTALKGGVPFNLNSLTGALTGDQTQYMSLVVPSELKEDGDERRGSSRLILAGKKKDLAKAVDQKKARGVVDVAFGVSDEAPPPPPKPKRNAPNMVYRSKPKKEPTPRDPLKEQLNEGLTPYVPVASSNGNASNALCSTAKVIEEVLQEYHRMVPPRRVIAAPSQDADGPASSGQHGHGTASSSAQRSSNRSQRPSSASAASMGSRGPRSSSGSMRERIEGAADTHVRTVRVQEIDLFSTWRHRPVPPPPPSTSAPEAGAEALGPPATPRATIADSRPRSMQNGSLVAASAGVADDAASIGAATTTRGSVSGASVAADGPAAAHGLQGTPSVHGAGSEGSAAGARVSFNGAAGGRPPPDSDGASSSHMHPQRHVSTSGHTAVHTVVGHSVTSLEAGLPEQGGFPLSSSPQTHTLRPQSAAVHGSSSTMARTFAHMQSSPAGHSARPGAAVSNSWESSSCTSGLGAVPGTQARRMMLSRPGSAAPTAKTNSRSRNGLLSDLSIRGHAPVTKTVAAVLCTETTPPDTLQNRVLHTVALKYIDRGNDPAAAAEQHASSCQPHLMGASAGLGTSGMSTWAGAGATAGTQVINYGQSFLTKQQGLGVTARPNTNSSGTAYKLRPHSAPQRRMRPASAGAWAGRPDPSTILAAAIPRSQTGLLYDPAVSRQSMNRWQPVEPAGY